MKVGENIYHKMRYISKTQKWFYLCFDRDEEEVVA